MSCFDPITGPLATVLVLVTGLSTLFGYWGLGSLLLRAMRWNLRWNLPSPWRTVMARLTGFQGAALSFEVPAMPAFATRPVLIGTWGGRVAVGWISLVRSRGAPTDCTPPRCEIRNGAPEVCLSSAPLRSGPFPGCA